MPAYKLYTTKHTDENNKHIHFYFFSITKLNISFHFFLGNIFITPNNVRVESLSNPTFPYPYFEIAFCFLSYTLKINWMEAKVLYIF